MRLYTTLLISLLALGLRAETAPLALEFDASIGLASTFCTDPGDPDNCLAVPSGQTMITVDPNAVEDIVVTYRVDNNTAATINQGSLTDSQFGVIIPAGPINIAAGAMVVRTRRFTPPTVPGVYTITATLVIGTTTGGSQTKTFDYIIEVLGADPQVEVFVLLADGFCTDTTDLATCPVAPNTTPNTLTVAPGEIFYQEFRLQNTGTAAVKRHDWDDSFYGLVEDDTPATANPGADLRFRRLHQAPTVPGTYNITVDYEGRDDSGNSFSRSTSYTLIVPSLFAEIEVFPLLAEGFCTDTTDLATCPVAPTSTSNTLTVAPGEKIYMEFRLFNVGQATINRHDWDDSFYGLLQDNTPATTNPGSDLRFRQLIDAPTVPGTYNITVDYEGRDNFGNAFNASTTYTLIVPSLFAEIEVFPLLAEGFCTDTTDLATCPVAPTSTPNTLTVGPGQKIYMEFRLFNVGQATINRHDWDDSFYGLLQDNTPATTNPSSDLRFRQLVDAPTVPGTYNITVDYEGRDNFGNAFNASTTYTLIVPSLFAEIEVFPLLAEGFCTDTTDLATCPVAPTSTPNTLTVGPGQKIYMEFRLFNVGLATINRHDWDDSFYGLLQDNTPATTNEGSDLRFRQLVDAPTVPGTYNITVDYEGRDNFGNAFNVSTTYTLIVPSLFAEIEVFPLLADGFCTDTGDLATCPVAPNTTPNLLSVGPGQIIYMEFRLYNVGLATIKRHDWDDSFYGLLQDNTPATTNQGSDLRFRQLVAAPSEPGVYNITVDYEGRDDFGNSLNLSTGYLLTVNCNLGDEAPPTAICQDRTFTLGISEMVMISPDQIDNGSVDGCGGMLDFGLSQTTFDCDDVGVQTVTLNVRDQSNNMTSCTADITIEPNDIFVGNNFCIATNQDIQGLNSQWIQIFNLQGKRVAAIDPGPNTNLAQVRVYSRKAATTVLDFSGEAYLGRRTTIEFRNTSGQIVQPNNSPVGVRLFYTDDEGAALFAADPGSTTQTLAVLKTDQDCSAAIYDGTGVAMNISNRNGQGCGRNYLEFFTGGFSTFYLFADDDVVALPVEYLDFSAQAEGEDRVRLDWATVSESGNSHFVIERSEDGRQFQAIGQVAGNGSTNERQDYWWHDEQPLNGHNFYRLRQVDFSGEEALSELRLVRLDGSTSAGLTLYPNPASEYVYLDGFAGGEVEIIDATGRQILRQYLSSGEAVSVLDLASGSYYLRVLNSDQQLRFVR